MLGHPLLVQNFTTRWGLPVSEKGDLFQSQVEPLSKVVHRNGHPKKTKFLFIDQLVKKMRGKICQFLRKGHLQLKVYTTVKTNPYLQHATLFDKLASHTWLGYTGV